MAQTCPAKLSLHFEKGIRARDGSPATLSGREDEPLIRYPPLHLSRPSSTTTCPSITDLNPSRYGGSPNVSSWTTENQADYWRNIGKIIASPDTIGYVNISFDGASVVLNDRQIDRQSLEG